MGRKKWWLAVVVLGVAVGGAWLMQDRWLAWYYLRELAKAGDTDRDGWAERVAGLDSAAVPGLLELLRGDARACENARAALARLTERWPADDPRWADMADRVTAEFPHLSADGRRGTLGLMTDWLRADGPRPEPVRACAGRLLTEAARDEYSASRTAALELAASLLELPEATEQIALCRELASKGLTSAEAENRSRAIRVAMHPGMDLQARVTPLLSDPSAEVRRAAMLAVGPLADAIATDNLLPWLHDPDADVRRLCEAALLAREDFQPDYLAVARLITAPQAAVRLQVLDHLQRESDLEPGIWLLRLSHDPAPEVRAAAARAAAGQHVVDLTDRLEQMARSDPSPTVSQLARYYLTTVRPR